MKKKAVLIIGFILLSMFTIVVKAQTTPNFEWRDDFNYTSLDEMEQAGWMILQRAYTQVGNGYVILDNDGVIGTILRYYSLPLGIYEWKAESKGMWIGRSTGSLHISVETERHSYTWTGDGYYPEYVFYRDGVKVCRFPGWNPVQGVWFIFTLVRMGNTFYMYLNGQLMKTYTELDEIPSTVTGIGVDSAWIGTTKYDYVSLSGSLSKILPVPYYAQGNTNWCGITSLAMVLSYYGENVHNYDIAGYLKISHDAGVHTADLDKYMKDNYPNYPTKPITYDSVTDQIFDDITKEIDAGYPVILGLHKGILQFHAVVIVGYQTSPKGLFYNDPSGSLVGWATGTSPDLSHLIRCYLTWDTIKSYVYTINSVARWFQNLLGWGSATLYTVSGSGASKKGTIGLFDGCVLFDHLSSTSTQLELGLYLNKGIDWTSSSGHKKWIDNMEEMTVFVALSNHLSQSNAYTLSANIEDLNTGTIVAALITILNQPIEPLTSGSLIMFQPIQTSWVVKGHDYILIIWLINDSQLDDVMTIPLPHTH